jgi:hypothetical protein
VTAGYYDPPPPPPDHLAPVLPFDDFLSYEFDWAQNQHMGVVGPTEQGKTNLAHTLLQLRAYVAYLAIKTQDETLDAFTASGEYTRIYDWPPMKTPRIGRARPYTAEEMPRRLVWPDARQLDSEERQQQVFGRAMHDIYVQGGWCVVLDDYWYLAHILGFEKETKKFLANARSNYIPMVVCAQRPAGNRLVELFDQTTHLFFFRDGDEPNLNRISGVGATSARAIRGFVANLDRFQFLYVNTRDGRMFRSTAPELKLAAASAR